MMDSTHVFIAKPQDRVLQRLLSFNKGDERGHAIRFNVFINRPHEVIACLWWYPPNVCDTLRPQIAVFQRRGYPLLHNNAFFFRPMTQILAEIQMLLSRGVGMGLALICALATLIIGHIPTRWLGCRGDDRSMVCAKPAKVEAGVEVVVVEIKVNVVLAGAMVEDGLGNMHNMW